MVLLASVSLICNSEIGLSVKIPILPAFVILILSVTVLLASPPAATLNTKSPEKLSSINANYPAAPPALLANG